MGKQRQLDDRKSMSEEKDQTLSTRLIHAGRSATRFKGAVNPPIQRASTILTETVNDLYGSDKSLYGRMGTEVHAVLCDGLKALESASHVQLTPNGLSACSLALAACVSAGDHVLLTDSAYGPTRRFVERYLRKMGVETDLFDPRISASELANLLRDNTKAVFFEAPGSLTFELHDLKALIPICRSKGITTLIDNTWSAGVCFKPLTLGIDISVQALTKYVIGHSDGFGGAVMTQKSDLAKQVEDTAQDWGLSMSPDDAYLAQRGLRTLTTRLRAQGESALGLAHWLTEQPQVSGVYHPALDSHPDHDIWKDLFTGSSGLFAFSVHDTQSDRLNAFFASLRLFGFGFSWGGFESLMIPCDPQLKRTKSPAWKGRDYGTLIRVSVGLENQEDLKQDLEKALQSLSTHL
tara:strand:- start:1696 stop:2916 length:1221 start_codon:yes stop_codon:yes gene_type:complete